jgi:tRNA pseudouridine55 synthase
MAPASGESAGRPAAIDGVLVVDKPEGPTSHDVVARARRALGTRQVGHTGTLDPMATGVLALVVGRATRLAQFLSARDKSYEAVVRLGVDTDTWDRTGTAVSGAAAAIPGRAEVEAALASLVGTHDQAPPPYSAKKVDGVRAYRLAREGKPVNVAPARVTLIRATLRTFEGSLVGVSLDCSAGYYVRALAHELGVRLGCGACLETLRRTASGRFTLSEAVPLDWLDNRPEQAAAQLVPMERTLPDLPGVVLTASGAVKALHGNDIGPSDRLAPEGPGLAPAFRLLDGGGRLLAVGRPGREPGVLHPAVVLG